MPSHRRRIKIAIVGSASIPDDVAKKLAKAILLNLTDRYELTKIITIKEDPVGRFIRSGARPLEIPLKTYEQKRRRDQSNDSELIAGAVYWETNNVILVHNGSYSWAEHLREMIDRRPTRRYKMLEIAAA